MEVTLHIGLPKCGSTAIQGYFADHHDAHLAHGVLYPETGREPVGYRRHEPLLRRPDTAAMARGIVSEAKSKGACRILISNEGFCSLPPTTARAVIHELALAAGAPLRIVAWMRHPVDLFASSLAQFVLGGLWEINRRAYWSGGRLSPDRFLGAFAQRQGHDFLSLLGHTERIRRLFEGHDIIFRSVERADLGRGGLLSDVAALMAVPEPVSTELERRRNQRVSPFRTAVFAEARFRSGGRDEPFAAARPTLRRSFRLRDRPFASSRLILPPDAQDLLRTRLDAERPALAEIFSTPVAALTEPRPVETVPDEWLTPGAQAKVAAIMAKHAGSEYGLAS